MARTYVRVGLIGCGNIGARAHAPAYAHIPDARLVAVCDLNVERARRVAAATGADVYLDYHDLLARADVDAVDICLPTYLHARVAIEALQAGKHVLCEKPMATTLEEADAMLAAARESDRLLMIGHVRRFDPRYTAVKEALDAGDIGRPVHVRRAERQHLPFGPDAWYWHPTAGGGIFRDIGVHVTDLFRWYLAATPVTVYAVARQVRPEAQAAGGFDHATLMVTFAEGQVGLAEISWAYPPHFGRGQYALLEVIGTEGRIVYSDRESAPMLAYDAETGLNLPTYFRFMSAVEDAFVAEIAHFIAAVRGDTRLAFPAEEARAALALALAAERSAREGRPISLTEASP